ncbi:MAG TPA: TonB-dependent receptor [Caulobacteraceae bacterium]|jgi:iron complex outermembrane receptor protein|nr:TonB-dependent receptor [Caulobacteraceae bacterium]
MANAAIRFLGVAAAIAAGSPLPAHAQTDAPLAVADVVVTARQRPEAAQSVPLAVRAITADRIRDVQPVQLSDLSGAAPNFSIERMGGLDTVMIRGAGGGGRTIGFDARTAVYLDGVYIAQPGALNRSLADAERVEVLRGPQGALFGRNTVSGAVNIISRAPGAVFAGEAKVWGGSREDRGAYASVDTPLVADKVWGRLSGTRETRNGFTLNLYDGSHDVGSIDLASYRAAVRVQADARLRFDLAADYALDRSLRDGFEATSNSVGTGMTDPYAPAPFQIDENTPRIRRNEQGGVSLHADYSLADLGSLTSISAYRMNQVRRRSDNDYSPLDLLSTDYHDHFGQLSQEVRLASNETAPLRYVVGAFYLHEVARSNRVAAFGTDTLKAGLPVAPGSVVPSRARIDSTSLAAFANLDYQLAPHWTLSGGLRLNHEDRTLLFDLQGGQSGALRIATLTDFHDKAQESRPTPSLSLTYAPSRTLSVYGRYAEGFKSGGWNVDFLNTGQVVPLPGSKGAAFAFGPENDRSYEVGLKAQLWGGRARFDATAFIMEFRDYQTNKLIAYPNGMNVIVLTNASSARSSGVELSAELRPASFLRFTVDAGTLDAHFGRFPGGGLAGQDASGNRLPFSPRFSARAGVELLSPADPRYGSLDLYVGERHKSFMFTGQENLMTESVPTSDVVDARLSWRPPNARFEFALWGRNLGDADYLTNSVRDFLGTHTVTHGDPRSYGVELAARF